MATKKKPVIKVEPVKVGEEVYKINDIDKAQKRKIMNALMSVKEGEPKWDLFEDIIEINGFPDEETLYWMPEVTTNVANAIINAINTKKKTK
tara:strand:+ start:586 stop:861 length:276 start_codon:yes stop_codon:yes gene_type:complete